MFYAEDEKLAVGDNMIVSGSFLMQQTPGNLLVAAGIDAEEDATYLSKAYTYMIWPYDDRGRLVGEDAGRWTSPGTSSSSSIRPTW